MTGGPTGGTVSRGASRLRARLHADGRPDDSGQLLLLVLAYVTIAAALIGVVVDASAVFLAQRSMSATADGAALAAAQTLDERQVYAANARLDQLPLSADGVAASAASYLTDDGAVRRFPGLALGTGTDGTTAVVTLRTLVDLPFTGGFLGVRGPVPLTVTARARSPFRS